MSFSKEIEDFDDDGFEGSMDEHRIFTEVFFGKDSGRCKKFLINRVINFECKKSKHKDSLCVNSENSSLTSHEDSYHISEDTKQCFGPVFSSEGHTTLMRNHPDMNVKRMKLSVDELSSAKCYLGKVFKYSDPSKGVISTYQSDSDSISQRVTCLVESSTQGLTSSCYMLGQQGDMDTGDMTDSVAALCKFSEEDGNEKKEAVANTVITSPISQESYVTKLLIASSSVGIENVSVSGRCPKPKWKDSCFVQLDVSEMSLVRESPNDPRPLLRYYTHQLLRAAGWVIGRRKRSNKFHGLGEYVFKSPEGRPIREFRRAWKFCGERLFENANNMMKLTDDKQWTSMNQFWSDLSHTLREFEERLNNTSSIGALSYCWCLLDPFAHVVFIDKKLGSLKAGKVVKSMRSLLIDSYAKHNEVITSGCKFLVDNVGGTGSKYGEISGNERSQFDQCSLPAYGSESTWDQNGTGHFEFPINSRKANTSAGVFDIVSPCQGSNTSSAFCGKLRSGHDDKVPLSVIQNVCNDSYKRDQPFEEGTDKLKDLLHKSMDNCSNHMNGFTDAISKRKAHKKLKKISEIKLSGLYPNGNLGQSTFHKVESHDISIDNIPLPPGVQDCLISTVASDGSCKKSALCSFQQSKKKKQNEFKMLSQSGSAKQVVKYRLPKDPDFVNIEDGKKTVLHGKNGQKKSYACQLKDDDLLISAFINNKSSRYASKRPTSKRISCKSNALRKRRSQKGRCRLLPRSFNKGGKHFMEGKWFAFGLRTVLSWLINSGVVSLNEVIQYRNLKDDNVVKNGLVTKDGILCRCCDKMFSISEFKCHAGFKLNRTCLNLFMESGKPFTLCQLEAWSAEYKARKSAIRTVQVNELDQNDDSCGLCGDGGELLCCDNCPSTFHQACLFAQELPEGNWYCRHCTCQICGDLANVKQILKSFGGLQCLQCENKYHEACLLGNYIRATSDSWFCSEGCQEVYSGLSSRVGFMNLISDGFYWTILRCIHGDQKVHSAQRFIAMKAECNSKLAVALTIMEECFLPMVDPRTGIDMIPHVLYNWGSQFARLNYSGFYTVVLEKDDVLISVASLRIHGVTVAEMPLIATCSKYRRQGMCRRLMNSIEKMLKVFKVEMLVISAIPSLVETWTVGFGFKPLEDSEKSGLSKINLMVFPGTIWLKKSLLEDKENQKMGPRQMFPSEVDDYAENGHWPKGNASNEPASLTERNLPCEVVAVMENVCPDSMNVLQVGGELDSNLHEHFPKPSCEEPTSMSKDMELASVCHVESKSLKLYEEQPSFHKHSDKTCASQEIEK